MKAEAQTNESTKDKTLIAGRERRLAQIRQLNLFSDTFMTAVLKDKAACQYVLRILTSMPDLEIVSVRSQYHISQVASHNARLDVLAETEDKGLHSIEVQRADTVDHARRTRFYGAMVDSEFLERGKEYSDLPEATIYYISETDIWKRGRLKYTVSRKCDEADMEYDDGTSTVYVNAEVNDGSALAMMLQYFKTADADDRSHGALSDRVFHLKCEEGGIGEMCAISEEWFNEGRQEGRLEGRQEGRLEGMLAALTGLVKDGLLSIKVAADRADMSEESFIKYMKVN